MLISSASVSLVGRGPRCTTHQLYQDNDVVGDERQAFPRKVIE
jgi:hypothetical protein